MDWGQRHALMHARSASFVPQRKPIPSVINLRGFLLIVVAGLIAGSSCSDDSKHKFKGALKSDKTAPPHELAVATEEEHERGRTPREEEIAEDCVAFLRATKAMPGDANPDCPQCPARTDGKEVLKFRRIQVDGTNCFDSACEVNVSIHASFNPSVGGTIAGGLTGWISSEQKAHYIEGKTPPDEQVYKVKIIYRRDRRGWRAIEFDRA
jgi:hypothetical protein